MIPPIPVRDVTYSTDALRGRIDDLGVALEHGMCAVVSSGAWTHDGPARIVAAERVRRLLADIDRIRSALQSVWATIHPAEADRVATLGTAITAATSSVMSGPAMVAYTAWTGHLWPSLRPIADRAIELLPHKSPNIDLATTGSSPSLQAVRIAMESAGITQATPVVLSGHSQGGLIALAIAESRDFDVDAVITVGTPVGAVPDVTGIPTIHLVHPEDPVPAIGGLIDPRSSTWVVPSPHGERFFDAHHRQTYVPSAAALDELADARITSLRDAIQSTGVGVARDYSAVTTSVRRQGTGAE